MAKRATKKSAGDIADLISQADAARLLGLTRATVSYLVSKGLLSSKEVLGKKAVYRSEVEAYRGKMRRPGPKQSSKKKLTKG